MANLDRDYDLFESITLGLEGVPNKISSKNIGKRITCSHVELYRCTLHYKYIVSKYI